MACIIWIMAKYFMMIIQHAPKYNLIPDEDYIKYLAQDFDLMPYITVEENVGKFLFNIYKNVRKSTSSRTIGYAVEMTEFAKVKAKYPSGGQQQRVVLGQEYWHWNPQSFYWTNLFSQIDSLEKIRYVEIYSIISRKTNYSYHCHPRQQRSLSFSDETIVLQMGIDSKREFKRTLMTILRIII